jgi:hypothetical protein
MKKKVDKKALKKIQEDVVAEDYHFSDLEMEE